MCKLKFPSSKEMKKHIQEKHGAHLLFNVVQSVRKPIENCTVKYQKKKAREISNALKEVTGRNVPFRKNVFHSKVHADFKSVVESTVNVMLLGAKSMSPEDLK